LAGDFDFSGCGDCTSCPPVKQAEMSNSEPSAIVLRGIACMCGLYTIRMEGNGSLKQPGPYLGVQEIQEAFAAIVLDGVWSENRIRLHHEFLDRLHLTLAIIS